MNGEVRFAAVTGACGEEIVICPDDIRDDFEHADELAREAFRATGEPTRVVKLTELSAYGSAARRPKR